MVSGPSRPVLYFSSHGLYTVGASGDGLQALSEDVIPEELTGVTDVNTVLEYDHATRGVRIYIPTAAVNWLFETEQKGFWPFKVGCRFACCDRSTADERR